MPALLESKMASGARPSPSLLLFSLGLLLLCFTSGTTVRLAEAQKTWCVAKPSADEKALIANINYACGNVSCSVIQPGGPCYKPDNPVSHAAVAMNLYYATYGRHPWNCDFQKSALIVQSDPSYGSCTYY